MYFVEVSVENLTVLLQRKHFVDFRTTQDLIPLDYSFCTWKISITFPIKSRTLFRWANLLDIPQYYSVLWYSFSNTLHVMTCLCSRFPIFASCGSRWSHSTKLTSMIQRYRKEKRRLVCWILFLVWGHAVGRYSIAEGNSIVIPIKQSVDETTHTKSA